VEGPAPGEITFLLALWRTGDREAETKLIKLVYAELRRMAARQLKLEPPGHMLQPTALVNELYLRLAQRRNKNWKDRAHFFALSATLMRFILIDHARTERADKRNGGRRPLSFDEGSTSSRSPVISTWSDDLMSLDKALTKLHAIDPQQSRVVEMRLFGGMTSRQIAEVLKIGERTVERDWKSGKVWLHAEITNGKKTYT
jgi:RNA polymerase sigma factor (TIGR02999 family)